MPESDRHPEIGLTASLNPLIYPQIFVSEFQSLFLIFVFPPYQPAYNTYYDSLCAENMILNYFFHTIMDYVGHIWLGS